MLETRLLPNTPLELTSQAVLRSVRFFSQNHTSGVPIYQWRRS